MKEVKDQITWLVFGDKLVSKGCIYIYIHIYIYIYLIYVYVTKNLCFVYPCRVQRESMSLLDICSHFVSSGWLKKLEVGAVWG